MDKKKLRKKLKWSGPMWAHVHTTGRRIFVREPGSVQRPALWAKRGIYYYAGFFRRSGASSRMDSVDCVRVRVTVEEI